MYDPNKSLNGERHTRMGGEPGRLRSALSRIAQRLIGAETVPDLDDREPVARWRHLQESPVLAELDQLAVRLVILDEVAQGAEARLLAPEDANLDVEKLAYWRARFADNIDSFFYYHQHSSELTVQDVGDLVRGAEAILSWAEDPAS